MLQVATMLGGCFVPDVRPPTTPRRCAMVVIVVVVVVVVELHPRAHGTAVAKHRDAVGLLDRTPCILSSAHLSPRMI